MICFAEMNFVGATEVFFYELPDLSYAPQLGDSFYLLNAEHGVIREQGCVTEKTTERQRMTAGQSKLYHSYEVEKTEVATRKLFRRHEDMKSPVCARLLSSGRRIHIVSDEVEKFQMPVERHDSSSSSINLHNL